MVKIKHTVIHFLTDCDIIHSKWELYDKVRLTLQHYSTYIYHGLGEYSIVIVCSLSIKF